MADPKLRLPENVPGNYYVTSECIDCDMCRETAPSVFKRNDEIAFSVVFHQPEAGAERKQADEAIDGCPVEAIGKDSASPVYTGLKSSLTVAADVRRLRLSLHP